MTTLPATQTVDVLPAHLEDLFEKARDRLANAKAPATIAAYQSDMRHFTEWCETNGLPSLPTNTDTLVVYLFAHEDTLSPATLGRRLSAIKRIHLVNQHPDPISEAVKEALVAIKREQGSRQRRAGALSREDFRAGIDALDLGHVRGLRDRAILLLGFAGGFRRSELADLTVEDVTDDPDGIRVYIATSKTDQLGEGMYKKIHYGQTDLCPVRALRAWTMAAGIDSGPLFRAVSNGGNIAEEGISTKTINRVVKAAAAAAGLDPAMYSAHSLRRGHASEAIRNGARDHDVMQTTGWKSIEMVRTYYADVEAFAETDSSAMLGL